MAKPSTYLKELGRHAHRSAAEAKLGRKLLPGEVVHHIDHDKHNNSPENLAVMTQSEHAALHFTGTKRKPLTHCKKGHEFTEENTRITSQGRRSCVTCYRVYDSKWKKNKRRERGLKKPGAKPGTPGSAAISESSRRRARNENSQPAS